MMATMEPIKGTHQVRVVHGVEFKHATGFGRASEVAEGATVLHVGQGRALSLAQPGLFDTAAGRADQDRIPGA